MLHITGNKSVRVSSSWAGLPVTDVIPTQPYSKNYHLYQSTFLMSSMGAYVTAYVIHFLIPDWNPFHSEQLFKQLMNLLHPRAFEDTLLFSSIHDLSFQKQHSEKEPFPRIKLNSDNIKPLNKSQIICMKYRHLLTQVSDQPLLWTKLQRKINISQSLMSMPHAWTD